MPRHSSPIKLSSVALAETYGALAVTVLLAWNLGSMGVLMAAARAPVPIADQWDTAYFPEGWPGNLFASHMEHRPALGRLVGMLDWTFAAGGNQINAAFVLLCFPLAALGFYSLARAAGVAKVRAALAAGLVLAAMASGEQSENLLWGFQTAFVGSFVFELLALSAAVVAVSTSLPRRRWIAFAFCLLASVCAVFSLASGLLVLPAVLLVLIAARAPNPMRVGYALFAIAVGLGYFIHDGVGGVWGALPGPITFFLYILTYLGSALHPSGIAGAALCGGFSLAVLAVALSVGFVRAKADPAWPRSPHGAAYLALGLFALAVVGAAGMAGLGRSSLGVGQALSSRYGTACVMFWADLVILSLAAAGAGAGRFSRALGVFGWTLGGALALHTAVYQRNYLTPAHASKADRVNAMIAYDLGLRDHPALTAIYPIGGTIVSGGLDGRFDELKRRRKSIFAQDWPFRLGQPLAAWTRATGACRGAVDMRVAASAAAPVLQLAGWAWDGRRHQVPDLIVLTDAAGRTAGFGAPGYWRKDISRAVHSGSARYSGWRAFAIAKPGGDLRAYGIDLSEIPTACALSTTEGAR